MDRVVRLPDYNPPSGSGGGGGGGTVTLPIAESDVTSLVSDLAAKAPKADPTFTGTATLPGIAGPTTFTGTATIPNIAGPTTLSGTVTLPSTTVVTTQSASDNSTKPASTAYADTADALRPLKSTLSAKGSIYVASAASTPADLTIGTHLTHRLVPDTAAANGVAWKPHIVTRTGDATAITSGTTGSTLTSDDTLLWPMLANEVYYFMLNVKANSANTTMDLKVGMTGPSGATAQWGAVGNAASTVAGWGAAGTGGTPAVSGIGGSVSVGGANNADFLVGFAGLVFNSSTAGNLNIQFAQNTADPGNLTIKAYSHLILWRLA